MIEVEGDRGAGRLVPDGAAEAASLDGNGSCRLGRHSAATGNGTRRKLCGGPVPTVDKDTINIPAGTLDDDPGLRPQRHIFVDRKAPWFDIDGRLPRYPTK
jgi:hypothetical protein